MIEASIKQTDKGIRRHSDITPHDGRKKRRDVMEFFDEAWRFRDLVDALPVAIYLTDADGRITFFNRAAVKVSGTQARTQQRSMVRHLALVLAGRPTDGSRRLPDDEDPRGKSFDPKRRGEPSEPTGHACRSWPIQPRFMMLPAG